MHESRIFVVDDEPAALTACSMALRSGGFRDVHVCDDAHVVMDMIRETPYSLILLDLAMPGISGEVLLQTMRQEMPSLPVIIMTAFDDAETAMRCIRAGAHDYLTKPLDKDRLLTTVRCVLDATRLQRENARLKNQLLGKQELDASAFRSIITADDGMLAIFRYATAIAESSEPVLITGETGVGKDLMARAIHTLSGSKGQYVALNVAGLEEQMFSDVLFGHTKGAFTGALTAREGLLQKAAGGTIFLDEIGDVALPLQSRLLRVIESGEYYAGGSDRLKHTDARIIVATNRDVYDLCTKGAMRRDLLYRLDVHHIHIPPLRERAGDIPLLLDVFLGQLARERSLSAPAVGQGALEVLCAYDWPGNVRELKAVLTDAFSGRDGHISATWLRAKLAMPHGVKQPSRDGVSAHDDVPTIRAATESLVKRALQVAEGNQSRAAKMLGISQPALSRRLKGK